MMKHMPAQIGAYKEMTFSIGFKFIQLVLILVSTFTVPNQYISLFFFVWMMLMLLIEGKKIDSMFFLIIYIAVAATGLSELFFKIRGLQFLALYFMAGVRLIPVIMALYDLFSSPTAKICAFMSKMSVPKKVILGYIVVVRFLPVMTRSYAAVKDSMHNRNLWGIKKFLKNPVEYFERLIVPFLMQAMIVADRMAASAMVRGAESPFMRGSYYEVKWRKNDSVCLLLLVVFILLFISI